MADFDKPTLDDTYVNVLPDIRLNQAANALMFNGVTVSNIPVGAIQFAGGVFGTWNGASFDVTPVVIGGGGTGATTAAGARTNLDLYSKSESDAIHMSITANGSDINDASIFRTNIDVYSTSEVYTQTEVDTIVAFSSQGQAEAGTNDATYMNPLRTSQAIQAIGRTPVSIWTGSDTGVSDAEILASSGFTVVPGRYFITTTGVDYTVDVSNTSQISTGSSSVSIASSLLIINAAKRESGSFIVTDAVQTNSAVTFDTITEIKFTPL